MGWGIPLVPAILFGVGTLLVIWANIVFNSMLDEVNSQLPTSEEISPFFVNVKAIKVIELHIELFPGSRKAARMFVLAGTGFALGLVSFFMWVR